MNDHQSEKEHFLFSCLGTPRHWALGMAGFGWKMWKLCAQGGWTGPESWGPTARPGSKPCFPAEFPVNSIETPQGKPLLVVHILRAWRSAGIHMSLEVRQSRETVGAVWFCAIYSLDWQNDDAKQNFQMISDGLPIGKHATSGWNFHSDHNSQTPKFKIKQIHIQDFLGCS